MTNVRPISKAGALLRRVGLVLRCRHQDGRWGLPWRLPFVCCCLALLMYCIHVPVPISITRRRLQLRIFLLSGDGTTHTSLWIGMHPKKPHLGVFHPTTRIFTHPKSQCLIKVKSILPAPPKEIARTIVFSSSPAARLLHEPCLNATSASQPRGVADR